MRDGFGREITYLRLSVTDRCNLRCMYCMPAGGIVLKEHNEMLTQEEMIEAVQICSELGIEKVRITGGEPLIKKNILSICENISALSGISELCMTTNGTLLAPVAKDLRRCGVGRLNISLDTLDPDKFSRITKEGSLSDVMKGIEAALNSGFEKIKINTVLMKGFNEDEVRNLAMLTKRFPVDVRFIELMPMTAIEAEYSFLSCDYVVDCLPEMTKCEGPDRVSENRISENYLLPGAMGKVGLIKTVTDRFCSTCNRIRITADGFVKPCLHSGCEFRIKGMSKEEMKKVIEDAIISKPACRPEFVAGQLSQAKRTMNRIGG